MKPLAHACLRLHAAARPRRSSWLRTLPAGARRLLLAAVLSGVVGASVAACGGIPGDAVAQVNGSAITTATLTHWMQIAASATAGLGAGKTALPQPPQYRKCIAALASAAPKPAKGHKPPSHAQLRTQCVQEYTTLKNEALSYLISAEWLLQEAAARGVSVSDRAVHSELIKIRQRSFASSGAFERFLQSSSYTVSDLLLRVKLEILSERLRAKVLGKATVTQKAIASYYEQHKSQFQAKGRRQTLAQATPTIKRELQASEGERRFASFRSAYQQRWKARTDCRAGYVVSQCRQYKGTTAPGAGARGE